MEDREIERMETPLSDGSSLIMSAPHAQEAGRSCRLVAPTFFT
jgi:hypothetical protein